MKHDAHWIKSDVMLKNIQSCPLPSGSRSSEAKLTEQRISVLHKGLEMWDMDSASLYSGESIITKDPMQDREERQRGWGVENRCWCVQCCRPLPWWVSQGMQGRQSSEVGEANQHLGGVVRASNMNIYLELEAWAFCPKLVKAVVCVCVCERVCGH